MQGKLPGYKHSKSNLFTKVNDVSNAVGAMKGVYDAGRFLFNAGYRAYPYIARVAPFL